MTTRNGSTPVSWLSIARKSRRVSQRNLSALSGLSQPAISHIETGMTEPRTVTKRALAQALGYSVEDLFPPPGKRSPSAELVDWHQALRAEKQP